MHQVMLTMIYNKLILLHLNPTAPQGPLLHIYDLDPNYSYRIPTPVQLSQQITGHLIQLQVVENLIVIHDLDAKSSQGYDLKIGSDFGCGLFKEGCQVAKDEKSYMATIGEEEIKMNDESYKLTAIPLKTQFHQMVPTTEPPKEEGASEGSIIEESKEQSEEPQPVSDATE